MALAIDGTLLLCAALLALMLVSGRGLPQIRSLLTDPPATDDDRPLAADETPQVPVELVPGLLAAAVTVLLVPFAFAAQVARHGSTPGKAMFHLSVREVGTGDFPRYRAALGRELLRVAHLVVAMTTEYAVIVVPLLVTLDMNRSRLAQTWYDRVVGVVVVMPVKEEDPAE